MSKRCENGLSQQSLIECTEELLTVHQLNVPPLLRKTLHSTNPIESMFSQVSTKVGRVKSMKKGKMAQRWVAATLLEAEKRFRTIKGLLGKPLFAGFAAVFAKNQEL